MKQLDWKDPSTWPDDLPGFEIEPDDERLQPWADQFLMNYATVIAYHACRPVNIQDYYEGGLKPSNHAELTEQAITIFCTGEFPVISESCVRRAAKKVLDLDNGALYFCVDDRLHETFAPQYFRGSEYISRIAAILSRTTGVQIERLWSAQRNNGAPVKFTVAIPARMLGRGDLFGLIYKMNDHRIDGCEKAVANVALTLWEHLPPSCIIGHHYVNDIPELQA